MGLTLCPTCETPNDDRASVCYACRNPLAPPAPVPPVAAVPPSPAAEAANSAPQLPPQGSETQLKPAAPRDTKTGSQAERGSRMLELELVRVRAELAALRAEGATPLQETKRFSRILAAAIILLAAVLLFVFFPRNEPQAPSAASVEPEATDSDSPLADQGERLKGDQLRIAELAAAARNQTAQMRLLQKELEAERSRNASLAKRLAAAPRPNRVPPPDKQLKAKLVQTQRQLLTARNAFTVVARQRDQAVAALRAPSAQTPAAVLPERSGVVTWSGEIPHSQRFEIGDSMTAGVLGGDFPGVPIRLEAGDPDAVTILEAPSAANGWRTATVFVARRGHAQVRLIWTRL